MVTNDCCITVVPSQSITQQSSFERACGWPSEIHFKPVPAKNIFARPQNFGIWCTVSWTIFLVRGIFQQNENRRSEKEIIWTNGNEARYKNNIHGFI